MAIAETPLDVILNASDKLDGGQLWYCGQQRVARNDIAHAVLSGVPDGWAKVGGKWLRLVMVSEGHYVLEAGDKAEEVTVCSVCCACGTPWVTPNWRCEDHKPKKVKP